MVVCLEVLTQSEITALSHLEGQEFGGIVFDGAISGGVFLYPFLRVGVPFFALVLASQEDVHQACFAKVQQCT